MHRNGDYLTADLFADGVDRRLNIEAIELPDGTVGTVICNHVLEHVDDHQALRELNRVLKPGGFLVCTVPIVEGWEHTYENPSISTPDAREQHFGQSDHVRFYGRDFRDRVSAAGFELAEETTAWGFEVIEYGLLRGEKVFVYRKP